MAEILQCDEVEILSPRAEWLRGRSRNDYSQFGEDGLIEAALDRIGAENRWCFECGASDGVRHSNTKRLRDIGWNALLIDGDPTLYLSLKAFASDKVKTIRQEVTPRTFEFLLCDHIPPEHPDLGIIDVDGFDYYLLANLTRRLPRVLLIEYGYYNAPETIPPLNECRANNQAGYQAICDLGSRKGYVPLARTYCNVLMCLASAMRGVSERDTNG